MSGGAKIRILGVMWGWFAMLWPCSHGSWAGCGGRLRGGRARKPHLRAQKPRGPRSWAGALGSQSRLLPFLCSIYKKAGLAKEKRQVTYLVAKKGVGPRVRRPPGVKGQFKVVDSRLKKDVRAQKRKEQKKKRRK